METSSRKLIIWAVGVVVVFLILGGLVMLVDMTVQRTVSPLDQANKDLSTQISSVLHPTPTIRPDPVTIIQQVKPLARLETIQYSVEKVITAEVGQGTFSQLFGDKLLFVAHGIVIAGVDLSKINEQDIWYQGDTLYIRLPPAEVFISTLDNKKSYVYDRTTGLLNKGNTDLETNARKAAETEILKAAIEDGILDQAQINAESMLSRLFSKIGVKDFVFVRSQPTPAR